MNRKPEKKNRSRWGVALVALLTLLACGDEAPPTGIDTTTGGDPALKVKRIAFHEGYVVVEEEEGGRVFPIDRLIRFNWRASK